MSTLLMLNCLRVMCGPCLGMQGALEVVWGVVQSIKYLLRCLAWGMKSSS